MFSVGNFARIASLCVGFRLGTLDGYFFNQNIWPNLNFPLEHQIKLVLMSEQLRRSHIANFAYKNSRFELTQSVIT